MDQVIKISIINDDLYDEASPRPYPSVLMADNGTDRAYLTNTMADWSGHPITVLGEWNEDTGLPVGTPSAEYYDWVRPLGNLDGVATLQLEGMVWHGHSDTKYYSAGENYPPTNRPFILKIERTNITDDGFPHIPHGWKVTMISDDPVRDITARGIGIYNDAGGYLYTTGAFVDDGGGTYFTECPVGQRTADEQQINFKLLLGAAPEGAWTLYVGDQETEANFWADDQ